MANGTTTGSDTPPAGTSFDPAEPLKQQGASFQSDAGSGGGGTSSSNASGGNSSNSSSSGGNGGGAFFDQAHKLASQAGDKAREYAEDGKARAGDALDQFSQMLTEAAGQVEERLGPDYGKYARSAAEAVGGFSESLKSKNVDDLVTEARNFVAKSPAIAIGTAAALGFVIARLAKVSMDAANQSNGTNGAGGQRAPGDRG